MKDYIPAVETKFVAGTRRPSRNIIEDEVIEAFDIPPGYLSDIEQVVPPAPAPRGERLTIRPVSSSRQVTRAEFPTVATGLVLSTYKVSEMDAILTMIQLDPDKAAEILGLTIVD
jgi:hypothetical protein